MEGVEIEHTKIFEQLSTEDQEELLNVMGEKEFQTGQKIITQNEANDSFYVIKTGDAKVLLEVDPSSGKPITPPRELVQLGPGKFFGERALLKSEPASATIAAGDKGCVCYCCDRQDFVRLLGPLQALIDKAQAVEDRAACLTALALSHAFLLLSLLSPLSSLLLSC